MPTIAEQIQTKRAELKTLEAQERVEKRRLRSEQAGDRLRQQTRAQRPEMATWGIDADVDDGEGNFIRLVLPPEPLSGYEYVYLHSTVVDLVVRVLVAQWGGEYVGSNQVRIREDQAQQALNWLEGAFTPPAPLSEE